MNLKIKCQNNRDYVNCNSPNCPGQLIIGTFRKIETRAALVGALILGLAILRLLRLIPFVGFFFGLATVLFGLGAILVSKRKLQAEVKNIS